MTPIFSSFEHAKTCRRDALAHDIATRSMATVMRRLHADTATMTSAELRGYIRARALNAVQTEARKLIAARQVQLPHADELIAAALEQTVHIVVQNLLSPPVIAMPAPHLSIRSAA
ncbi:MAG: hypothetical protein WD738_13540 [Pirellulales bacterium]